MRQQKTLVTSAPTKVSQWTIKLSKGIPTGVYKQGKRGSKDEQLSETRQNLVRIGHFNYYLGTKTRANTCLLWFCWHMSLYSEAAGANLLSELAVCLLAKGDSSAELTSLYGNLVDWSDYGPVRFYGNIRKCICTKEKLFSSFKEFND